MEKYYTKDEVDAMFIQAQEAIDTIWIIVASVCVMMMQVGFVLLESGSVREKNTSNIMLKSIIDTFTGVLAFFICGYGLSTQLNGGIIGFGKFAGVNFNRQDYLEFLLRYSFCATSTTIVSGALAERMYVDSYIVFSMIMTGFLYPVASGWAWGGGWLQVLGYHDFSGSGVVHLLAGTSGLIGTYICGPRLGVIGENVTQVHKAPEEKKKSETLQTIINSQDNNSTPSTTTVTAKKNLRVTFEQSMGYAIQKRIKIFKNEFSEFKDLDDKIIHHLIQLYDKNFDKKFQFFSIPYIVIGTYLLWVCWLFFNGVAGKSITKKDPANIPQQTIMNTMISGAISSLVVFFFQPYILKKVSPGVSKYHPVNICNGLLSGLVSITAGCNNVHNYSAIAIGFVGGFVFIGACWILAKLRIDDPCSASQIHGFCGLWGVISVGFFDKTNGVIHTGDFRQVGVQALGAFVLILLAALVTIPYFKILMSMKRLRVSTMYEIIGLDILMHEERDKLPYINENILEILEQKKLVEEINKREREIWNKRMSLKKYRSLRSSAAGSARQTTSRKNSSLQESSYNNNYQLNQ